MDHIFIGTLRDIVVNFADSAGNPVDPDTVTAEIKLPDDTVVQLAVIKEEVGQYSAAFTPTLNGLHRWRFDGDSAAPVTIEDSFMAQSMFVEP